MIYVTRADLPDFDQYIEYLREIWSKRWLTNDGHCVRLLEETQRQVEQEAALNRITTRFAQNLDFDSLLQTVVSELGQLSNVRDASIHIIPPEPSNGDQHPGAEPSHATDDDDWRSI